METIKYVNIAGLQVFKRLIENKISNGDAKSLKTVLIDEERSEERRVGKECM